jgi:hypothetical protein
MGRPAFTARALAEIIFRSGCAALVLCFWRRSGPIIEAHRKLCPECAPPKRLYY